jgi:hypothetical protein
MKCFSLFGRGALLLMLFGSCSDPKQEDPAPIPSPNVFVHYKLLNTQGTFFTIEVKSYAHNRPDSTFSYVKYSQMWDWESTMPMTLPGQTDIEATLLFPFCDGVPKVLPPGGQMLVELIAKGQVQKRILLEAASKPYALPEVNKVTLTCAER